MARIRLAASFQLIKYALFLFNFIFWVFGIVIFAIGIYACTTDEYLVLNDHYTGAYLFIFVGFIMMVTGFLGCCGSIKESPCMLILFFLVLFFIFVLLMSAGLWAIAYKGKLSKNIEDFLSAKVSKYDTTSSKEELLFLDNIQNNLKCCGVYKHTDYAYKIPKSCGETPFEQSTRNGCHPLLMEFLKVNLNKIIGIAIFIAIIMLLGMTFSIMLCCAIKETEKLNN